MGHIAKLCQTWPWARCLTISRTRPARRRVIRRSVTSDIDVLEIREERVQRARWYIASRPLTKFAAHLRGRAPVAQGIEHRPPEAGARVRISPGAPAFGLVSCAFGQEEIRPPPLRDTFLTHMRALFRAPRP